MSLCSSSLSYRILGLLGAEVVAHTNDQMPTFSYTYWMWNMNIYTTNISLAQYVSVISWILQVGCLFIVHDGSTWDLQCEYNAWAMTRREFQSSWHLQSLQHKGKTKIFRVHHTSFPACTWMLWACRRQCMVYCPECWNAENNNFACCSMTLHLCFG